MEVIPFVGVGDLLFSDSREQIRGKLKMKYSFGFKEFGNIKEHYDHFEDIGLIVYYNGNNELGAFEFFEANPIFNGINLLNSSYCDIVSCFKEIDADLHLEETGVNSMKFGIVFDATYATSIDDKAYADSVFIHKKGYYESF